MDQYHILNLKNVQVNHLQVYYPDVTLWPTASQWPNRTVVYKKKYKLNMQIA